MSIASELTRLKRDVQSLAEEIAGSTGASARIKLLPTDRRTHRADLQALIQQLDELSARLSE